MTGGFPASTAAVSVAMVAKTAATANTSAAATAAPRPRAVSQPLTQLRQTLMAAHTPAGKAIFNQDNAVRNLILEQRAAFANASREINEQMTINVVAMLLEFILRDNQIPAEVRAQLGRLQFLVPKLALRESTLLTQKGRPARMLINRIGAISIGLQQLDPNSVRISNKISRIVDVLPAGDTDSSPPFPAMPYEFNSFIATELRKGDVQVERAAQVIEHAQNRTLRFTHIAGHAATTTAENSADDTRGRAPAGLSGRSSQGGWRWPATVRTLDNRADKQRRWRDDALPIRLDDDVLVQVRTGLAVELSLGSRPGMARLNWIDPGHSTLILTVAGHATPSLISASMFQRMLTNGRLHFVETKALFERAVVAVLQPADDLPQPTKQNDESNSTPLVCLSATRVPAFCRS